MNEKPYIGPARDVPKRKKRIGHRWACCGHAIIQDQWANSGFRKEGEIWKCPICETFYAHVCDEADGCAWERMDPQPARGTAPSATPI